jgi:hypothetical protein
VQFEFVILDWSAYAAGLTQRSDWLAWADAPPVLPGRTVDAVPALAEMPAMMRRRVDRLGRLACQVAYWAQESGGHVPMVFASRYGDASRSLALLADLVRGEPLSPTSFALSVHNAVSALYSIAQGHTDNTVVVAAGRATVAAALTEAAALLADGAPEVLVVHYEAPLPDHYAAFQDEPACEYAWAWRVARPVSPASDAHGHATVCVQVGPLAEAVGGEDTAGWPAGLAVLRHMLRQQGGAGGSAPPPLVRQDRVNAQWSWSSTHA